MTSSAVLATFPLFQDISPAVLEKIAAISEEFTVKQGDFVFREGEKADKLYFLLKGSVTLKVKIMTKPDAATVSFVEKPHQCFGWSGIVPPYYYTSSAICESDSQVMDVVGSEFMRILESNPTEGFVIMRRITEIVSDRLRNSHHALLKTL